MPQSEGNNKKKKNMKKKKHKEEENSDFKTNCTKEVKILLKIMLFKMSFFIVYNFLFLLTSLGCIDKLMNRTLDSIFLIFFSFIRN